MEFNIKDIIDNYKYIKSLNIIDIKDLNQLLFGEYISLEDDIVEILTNSINEDGVLPEYSDILNLPSTNENKLIIRDRFTYLLVNGIEENKLRLFSNDLSKSINLVDEDNNFNDYSLIYPAYNNLLKNNKYKDYFWGISNKLFKLLNSINHTYYEKISNLDESVIDFIDNLDTIKNWNNLEELERKQRLLNEIIAKILYASIDYSYTKYKDNISKEDFINSEELFKIISNLKLTNKLLESCKKIDNDELIIKKVIELYPYSVETFDKKYYSYAEEYGYKLNTKLVNCAYFLFNNLNVDLISTKEKTSYLNNLINIFNKYKNNKNDEYLYNYLIGLDTYIRNINYFDPEINNYNKESLEIFNKDKYKNIDRIKYLSKLIKKYYDSTLNTTLGNLVIDLLPIDTLNNKIELYNEIEELKDISLELSINYELNVLELNDIINKKGHLYNEILDFYNSKELIIITNSLLNSNKLDDLINDLLLITNKSTDKNVIKEKIFDNSSSILIMLKKLCDTNKKTREYIDIYLLEKEVMELIKNV